MWRNKAQLIVSELSPGRLSNCVHNGDRRFTQPLSCTVVCKSDSSHTSLSHRISTLMKTPKPPMKSRGNDYCTLAEERPVHYVDVPSHETTFRVPYYDVGPRTGGPVILAYHGAPGTFNDFDEILDPLCQAGVRVLVPTIPGNPMTVAQGKNTFDSTTTARARFIQDFMGSVDLKTVDVMMAHSLGSYPVMHVAAHSDVTKGVALFNHGGFVHHRGLRPYPLAYAYGALLQLPVIGKLARIPLRFAYNQRGFKVDDVEHLTRSMFIVKGINFRQMRANGERFRDKNIPMLTAVAQNDKLIEWQISLQFSRLCGISDELMTYLDADRQVVKGPSTDEALASRTLIFERGGHLVHRAHSELVAKCLVDLVRCVNKEFKLSSESSSS